MPRGTSVSCFRQSRQCKVNYNHVDHSGLRVLFHPLNKQIPRFIILFPLLRISPSFLTQPDYYFPEGQHKVEQVERLAIHIRFGDITISEPPEIYVKAIEGMRRKLNISLPADRIHFIYYQPSIWSWSAWKRLQGLKRAIPGAQYHNMASIEETIRYMIGSKYLMTSGSSLSYVAAYFCPNCHVISTMPKEHTKFGFQMTEENYSKNFYHMDEWEPIIHYYSQTSESN